MPPLPLSAGLASALLGGASVLAAGAPIPSERRAFLAVAVALVAAAAFSPFVSARPASGLGRAAAALGLAAGPALAALASGFPAGIAKAAATFAVAGAVLACLGSIGAAAREAFGAGAAAVVPLGTAALLLSDVFAATPLLEYWGDDPAAVAAADILLAANPLAALAFPVFGIDWIRRPILYASSPISSFPFRYPSPAASALTFLAAAALFEAARAGLARRVRERAA